VPLRTSGRGAFLFVICSLTIAGTLCAQLGPRIVGNPENGALVRIPGSTHPLVGTAKQTGRAPASLTMERMMLQLESSPEQESALAQLLVEQQDPESPHYHDWLTPEQFGEQFGVSQQDLDSIAGWLQSRGFRVTEISAGRRAIEFSGTVHQVEAAFHAEINRYEWNGREHIANGDDISIPAALAPVVKGVVSLHNFELRSFHRVTPAPQTDFSGSMHALSPSDFATIYDLAPLWNAGYDGTGQSIAVIGQTDIKLSDIATFRSTFGLPANPPTVIVNGSDPGIVSGDEVESDLDVEWAGAVAKGATVKFVTSASTNASDGITLSAQYIVQHATAPVVSLSYGLCEAQASSANSFYSSLWQQAAAEGIAVFVAAGDSGSAACDAANSSMPASQGFGVNGLASTPYNVAVGGTEFNDTASPSLYWTASNNGQMASAIGYIPEMVWNESSYGVGLASNSLFAGGGGASCLWPRPAWQSAPGMPSGSTRLTPDVSLTAAGHDGYLMQMEGGLYLIGGTSASTPSFAGLMAVINQYTHTANGNPNSKLYALASSPASVFHDVVTGSNAVPCQGGSSGCLASAPSTNFGKMTGYSAATGYDLATGLGSVDAMTLAANWSGTPAAPAIVSLSPNPMTGASANQSLTINGAGFAAGSSLTVVVGSSTYQGSSVSFVSSTQLVVSVNVGTSAQTLPVQVTIPGGKKTNSVNLTVTAAGQAPAIATLSPNPMTGSTVAQTLTVNGSGFAAGSALKVTVGGTTYQGSQVIFVSSTQLTVSVTVGSSAQGLPVQVTDPSGLASNSMTLTVTAAPPAVSSLSPNPIAGSNSPQLLTIAGNNFVAGTGLKVTVGGTVYQGAQISSITSSQLIVSVGVGITAQSMPVVVTNPSGQASAAVNLTVTAPTAAPVVTGLNPNPMTGSTSAQGLIVFGTGFVAGSALKVTVGVAAYQGSQIVSVTGTQIVVSVLVGASAQTLPVVVTVPSGQASNPVYLTVVAPLTPVISAVSPNPMMGSTSPQTFTITGAGFQAGLQLSIGGSLITANQLAVLTPTQLQINVVTGLSAYVYPVQVVSAGGLASNSVNLQVNAPPVPAITSLMPNPLVHSKATQVLTVNGTNFQSGVGLKVMVGTTLYSGGQVMFVSASQLEVAVTAASTAPSLAVQVTNPSGQVSNSVPLTVM